MSTDTNQTAAPADTRKYKTLDDVDQRLFFDSRADRDAFAADLQQASDFASVPLLFPADYAELEGRWMFAKNGQRVPVDPNDRSQGTRVNPTSLVFTPVPSFEEFLADDEGRKLLEGLLATRLDHALASRIKKLIEAGTTDPESVASLPRTVSDFSTTTRGDGDGGLLASYKALSGRMLKFLAKNKPWSRFAWTSAKLRYALQSAAYARSEYPEIEAKGGFAVLSESFKSAVPEYNAARAVGKPEITASLFDQWAANRDTYMVPNAAGEDDDDADFDSLEVNPFATAAE